MNAVEKVEDQYDFWRRRLAGEVVPIHDGEPQAGFYRARDRAGAWHPVAYWYGKDGVIRCRVGGSDISEQAANERWPHTSKNPITHEVYKDVIAGKPWPFQNEAVLRDNGAPADDVSTFDGLKDRIEDLARDAQKLIEAGGAKNQDEVDRASDLANRLAELQKQADAARAGEKKPHDEAAAAVQAKWKPLLGTADIYRRIKEAVITPFLRAEMVKQRAAEDEARKAAEEAAKAGRSIPEPTAQRAAPKAGAGGRRSVALRSVKVVTITDRAALLAFFADNTLVTELLHTLATKATNAGVTVPGVTVTEDQRAA